MRGTDTLDYDIGSATTRAVPEPRGVFDDAAGTQDRLARPMPPKKDAELAKNKKPRRGKPSSSSGGAARHCFPVDVDFKFEGKARRAPDVGRPRPDEDVPVRRGRRSSNGSRSIRDRKVALDANWLNNGRRLEPDTRVSTTLDGAMAVRRPERHPLAGSVESPLGTRRHCHGSASIVKGLWTALKNPKLVLLLWAWNLLLALAATMPARAWFGGALDSATETDSLLDAVQHRRRSPISAKYNDVPRSGWRWPPMIGVGLVALVGNAFMNGGIVEVIGSEGRRAHVHAPFLPRRRPLLLAIRAPGTLLAVVSGAIVGRHRRGSGGRGDRSTVGLGVGARRACSGAACRSRAWLSRAPGSCWRSTTRASGVARDGSRGMVRVYRWGGFVARHLLATYSIAILALSSWRRCSWRTWRAKPSGRRRVGHDWDPDRDTAGDRVCTHGRAGRAGGRRTEYFLWASPAQPAEPAAAPVPVVPEPTVPVESPPPAPTTEVTTEVSDAAPTRLTRP